MYLKVTLLALLFSGFSGLATFVLSFNLVIVIFGKRIFAAFLDFFSTKYNEVSDSMKVELFKELNDTQPGEKISILEVGGGSGCNFKYWQRPASVLVVEPNPHFVPFFDQNRAKFPKLDIQDMKQGVGEDLAAAGVADSSVDAVVMTLVLCTVDDQIKTLSEVKRVLKPGGKFYYMEHIIAQEGRALRYLQQGLMLGGFWTFLVDGCCADRATDQVMETAGFSKVVQRRYDLPLQSSNNWIFKAPATVIQPHVLGVATK